MTPKEKAKELVDKYFTACHKSSDLELSWKVCKHCALFAVDEILGEINSNNVITPEGRRIFWQQVKTEIKKL